MSLANLLKGRVALITGAEVFRQGCRQGTAQALRRRGKEAEIGRMRLRCSAERSAMLPPHRPASPLTARSPPLPTAARTHSDTGSSTGIGAGILKQLAAAGATTVMHGLVAEDELRQKAAAVQQQYGTVVGTSTANLMNPQEIRCVWEGGWPQQQCCRLPRGAPRRQFSQGHALRPTLLPSDRVRTNGLARPDRCAGTWCGRCRRSTASWTSWWVPWSGV